MSSLTEAEIEARIEDLFFLDNCHVNLDEIVQRLNVTERALERFCGRHGVSALFVRAKHRGHVCDPSKCPDPMPPRPVEPSSEDSAASLEYETIGAQQKTAPKPPEVPLLTQRVELEGLADPTVRTDRL